MSTTVNQHFVPKFYLRNFSESKKGIFVFDKYLEKNFLGSINKIGSSEYFYGDDQTKNGLELFYGKIEAITTPIIKTLIERLESKIQTNLHENERKNLAKFIWHQQTRTLESRIRLSHLEKKVSSIIENKPTIELENLDYFKNHSCKKIHLDFLNSLTIKEADSIQVLYERTWVIFKNSTRVDFLTSDSPVISYRHEDINYRAFEIAIPISPKYLVSIVEKKTIPSLDILDGKIVELYDEKNIQFYNYLQISQSSRQLFSLKNDFDDVISIIKKEPNLKSLERKRFE